MTHALKKYWLQVDKTHKGLGRLFSFSLMCSKAKKVLIVVAVSGIGKTTAVSAAGHCNPDGCIEWDSITRSGLKTIEKELNGFEGTFIVGDLGNFDTQYSLKESIKTGVMLVYEHGLSKLNATMDLKIEDYQGSFLTTAQPVIMQNIINSQDWESVVRDKTVRYYHLYRPIKVNNNPIQVNVNWGKQIERVKLKLSKSNRVKELYRVGLDQWGIARSEQHINDMLKACAALDNRTTVTMKDVNILLELTQPMRLEKYLIDKQGFESDKTFLHNDACMLTEFATYHELLKDNLQANYQITRRTLERILMEVKEWYIPNMKDDNKLTASKQAFVVLKECGYW